jgi:hypothetical protein
MSCDFNTTLLRESLKKIVTLFQSAVKKNLNENNIVVFEKLAIAKEYVDGINIVNSDIASTSVKVNDCIQKYKVLIENIEIKKKDDTSDIMYSDTQQIVKSNLHYTVWIIFGIMLLCFFLYRMK